MHAERDNHATVISEVSTSIGRSSAREPTLDENGRILRMRSSRLEGELHVPLAVSPLAYAALPLGLDFEPRLNVMSARNENAVENA